MSTVTEIRNKLRRRLDAGALPMLSTLTAQMLDSADTFTPGDLHPAFDHGSIIQINDEIMFVTGVSGTTVSVIRGFWDTTAVTHSAFDLIYINPRWLNSTLNELITAEIRSWPPELGETHTVEVAFGASDTIVELDPGSGRSISSKLDGHLLESANQNWSHRRRVDWKLVRDADADEFPSGYAAQIDSPLGYAGTLQLDVLLGFDLSAIDDGATNLQTVCGIPESLEDVILLGVLWRAMLEEEIKRTDIAARAPQDSEQVPPTHNMQAAQSLKQARDERLSEERSRMWGQYPVLKTLVGG